VKGGSPDHAIMTRHASCKLCAVSMDVERWVSRGHAPVASANEAWAIRGLEGTSGEARHGRVLSDEGRGGRDERRWSGRGQRDDKIMQFEQTERSV
jgi:hypothetical protein